MFGLFSGTPFDPEKIPNLTGKVIIITGANGGLGYESLLLLAQHSPAKIYLCARSKAKYEEAMKGIVRKVPNAEDFVYHLELDLASLASVKRAAQTFLQDNYRLDILMNNAGIMAIPPALTEDGYETQFGTNHMGHFLFTKELLPLLLSTAEKPKSDVRIINLTSLGHNFATLLGGFVPETCKTTMADYSAWVRYGQSKLANILFTTQLAKRYPNITSVSIHPGAVATSLANTVTSNYFIIRWAFAVLQYFFKSPAQGALNQTWAAAAPVKGKPGSGGGSIVEVEQGQYYVPVAKVGAKSKYAQDEEMSERLWEWSEEELKSQSY